MYTETPKPTDEQWLIETLIAGREAICEARENGVEW